MASSAPAPRQIFNPRLVVGLIVAGIAAFAAFMLLLAFGDRIGSGRSGRANALSVSAVGFKGLVDLYGRLDHARLIRTREDLATDNLVVAAIEPSTRPEQVEQLLRERSGRPTLLVLPKWYTVRHPQHAGWVQALAPGAGSAVADRLGAGIRVFLAGQAERARSFEPARGPLAGLRLQVPLHPQLVAGPDLQPLLELYGSRPLDSRPNPFDLGRPNERARLLPGPLPQPPIVEDKPTFAPDKPQADNEGYDTVRIVPPRYGEGDRAKRGGGAGTTYDFARPVPSRYGGEERRMSGGHPSTGADRAKRGGGAGTTYEVARASSPPPPIVTVPVPNSTNKPTTSGPESDPALIAQLGDEPHYVLADPDLINNQALRDPTRARAAVELISRLAGPNSGGVGFDLTLNGYGAGEGRSMLRTAFEPPFLAMTLALFVAALLAGLHGAYRFGPARREQRAIAFGKAALVENSAGLIRLAGREARLGGAYADVMRQDMARAASAPGHLQGEALDRYLNRLAREGPNFSDLAADLATAGDRHTLMTAARRLWTWRKTVLR